ncbi:unnamed protein product [Callosobruchus maculatus]|uniref:Uncharacterized protein n=1 Tax=Callosobruchus maculatus TaxID=64391 RepID=A0A653DSG8_CALMS|nr:unnamed protein product [Callosobruchus maculatus]
MYSKAQRYTICLQSADLRKKCRQRKGTGSDWASEFGGVGNNEMFIPSNKVLICSVG